MPYQIQNFPSLFPSKDFSSKAHWDLVSSPSPAVWAFLAQSELFQSEKTLFIFPSHKDILDFKEALFFLDPQKTVTTFAGWQTYPSSQWLPNERDLCQRMKWLYDAQKNEKNLLCATVCDLSQKTLPLKVFQEHVSLWCLQDKTPSDMRGFLNQLGYKEAPFCENPGTYALRGGIFDIFSPASSHPVRGELSGDKIESLRQVDIVTQRSPHPFRIFRDHPFF